MKPLQLAPIDDEQNEDFARVAVADFVEKRYGIPFDEVSKDYEGVTTQLGLTGNAASHYAAIKANNATLDERSGKVSRRYNQGFFERNASQVLSSSLQFLTSTAAGVVDLQGNVGLNVMGMDTMRNKPEDVRATVEKIQGAGDKVPELVGTDKGYEQTFPGKFVSGGTQLAWMMAAPWSITPLMLDEGTRFIEESTGKKLSEMTPAEAQKADITRGLYMIGGGFMEKAGLGSIMNKLAKGGTKKAILGVLESMAVEGSTEKTQDLFKRVLTQQIMDADVEIFKAQDVLGMVAEFFTSDDFVLGATLGGTFKGVLTTAEVLYDKYLNTDTAATPLDFKTLNFIATDETVAMSVFQKTGSVEMAELAVRAKHGDPEAQAAYVEGNTVDPAEDVVESAGLTEDEAALFPEDTNEFPDEFYDDQIEAQTEKPAEFKKAALQEAFDFFSDRAPKGSTIEMSDDVRTFEHDLNDMRDAGYTDAEIEEFAFKRIQAAGQNDGKDYSGLKPSQFKVFGKNLAEFKGKVFKDVSFIYKGGSPLTVIEEVNHGYFERTIAEGTHTLQDFIGWKHSIEEASGEKTHSDEHEDVKEWVAQQAQAWMAGKAMDAEAASKIPPTFLRFLEQLLEYMQHVMARATLLRDMSENGDLDSDFETFLERSLGMDEEFLEQQNREEVAPDADGESLTDAVKRLGGLPRPDEDTSLRAELEHLFEDLGKNWKRAKKTGDTLDKLRERLNGEGFQFDTPNDLLNAMREAAQGRESYATADMDDAEMRSFSMGSTTVTPDANTQMFPTKDGGLIGPASYSLQAFHGTPHKVDKFSTEKIGTGEGAQVYGYGLYFAENEATAAFYRDALQASQMRVDGVVIPNISGGHIDTDSLTKHIKENTGATEREAHKVAILIKGARDKGAALRAISNKSAKLAEEGYKDASEEVRKLQIFVHRLKSIEPKPTGALYKVELNVEDTELLDWDKPIESQPEGIRKALMTLARAYSGNVPAGRSIENAAGQWLYTRLEGTYGGAHGASQALARKGIKGIKYLDGSSRSAGEGSSNYVIFNDADITITEENGKPVELPKPAASFSMAPYKERSGDEQGEPLTETEISEGIEDESGTLIEPEIDDDSFSNSKLPKVSYSMALDAPTIKRSDLKGKKKFVYFSDRTRVGVYEGLNPDSGIKIDLQGGPRFPFIEGHNGAQAGWAFTTEGMFTRFAKRVDKTDGIGLVTLYSKENLRANPTFLKAYVEELKWAIKSKKLTNKDFVREVNELRVAARNAKKKGSFAIPRESEAGKLFSKKWNTVEDFGAALSAATFDVRGGQFFAYDSGKASDNKGSKIATDKRLDMGFPDITKMVDMFVDPDFADAETGTIVSAVEFEKGQSKASSAKDIGSEEHLSYPVVIKGRGLGYFEDPIHVTDVLGVPAGKTKRQVSRSAETSMAGASFSMAPAVDEAKAKAAFKSAKKTMGETQDIQEAGYILPDGTLLDFSGKNQGGPSGSRGLDHRDIDYDGVPTEEQWSGMVEFLNFGAIRIDANSGLVSTDRIREITPQQKRRIRQLSDEASGLYLDMEDGGRRLSMEVLNPKKALGVMNRFIGGEDFEQNTSFSMAPIEGNNEQAPEPRPRTEEEGKLAQALREFREASDAEKPKLKKKLKELQLRAVESRKRQKLEASAMRKIEAEVNKRTEAIRRMAKERKDLTEAIKAMEKLVNNPRIPSVVRGRIRGYGVLSDRKTDSGKARYLEIMADRVDSEFNKYLAYEKKTELRKFLAPYYTSYGPNLRKLSARVGEEARNKLRYAAQLARNSEAPAPAGMSGAEAFALQSVFAGVLNYGSSADRIGGALKAAGEIAKGGRTDLDEFHAARKERNESRNEEVAEAVLNGEEVADDGDLDTARANRGPVKKVLDGAASILFHSLNGFQQMLNIMDRTKGGPLDTEFNTQAIQAQQDEVSMQAESAKRTSDDVESIFGGDPRKTSAWLKSAGKPVKSGIVWSEGGDMKPRTISKLQGVAMLMQWGDLSLADTFAGMGVDQDTINQLKEFIGPEGVKLASYLRARYAETGTMIQSAFKASEGFAMDLVDGYGGRIYRVDKGNDVEDSTFLFGATDAAATTKNGSMKERVGSTTALKFRDALKEFNKHQREAAHYISHAQLAKDLVATFRSKDKKVRRAIRTRHGDEFMDSLDGLIDDVIQGSVKQRNAFDQYFNTLRANLTKASLGLKPAILIKQLTSAPAFIEEIGFTAYSKAFSKFAANPMKWMKILLDTDYVKNRANTSQYADIQQQMETRSGLLRKVSISDLLMINVKIGDIGAVMLGGAAVYIHSYDAAIAEGKSKSVARQEAERVFAASSERAQQSSAMHSRGAFLRGDGLWRGFFMYLTSPIQYQRNINVALLNLGQNIIDAKKGNDADVKAAAKQAMRAVVVYHFILPQIFTAIASGLTGFGADDDEIIKEFWARQRKALLLGNANVFPVVGQIWSQAASALSGAESMSFWRSSGSPLIDFGGEVIGDVGKLFDGTDGAELWKVLEDVAAIKGIPLETGTNYLEAIQDVAEGDTDFPIQRLLGWSAWALGEKD